MLKFAIGEAIQSSWRTEADESRVLLLVSDFLSERAGRLPGAKVGSLDVG